jgi:hypothetical protein
VKNIICDKTGLPKEFLPALFYKGEPFDDTTSKLEDHSICEDDLLEIHPITLIINIDGGETVCLEGIDPFNDTVKDLKRRLGPEGVDVMAIEKQRLFFNSLELENEDDYDASDKVATSHASRRLFDFKINHKETLLLEKSRIDVVVRQPNGDKLIIANVDPRKDTLSSIEQFLSKKYYAALEVESSLLEDYFRPLHFQGEVMVSKEKSLRDYGFKDDNQVIEIQPMCIYIVIGTGDNSQTQKLDNVDPVNDNIYNLKSKAATDDFPLKKWMLLHKESEMAKIEEGSGGEKTSFYDHKVMNGHTIFIRRKPISIKVMLPKGTKIPQDYKDNSQVEISKGNDSPEIVIQIDPDVGDLATIHKHLFDILGVPVEDQRLNKILPDLSKQELDAPGESKLSSAEVNILDDCALELAPMVIHVAAGNGKSVSLEVLPFETIESVKGKLSNKMKIAANQQRLVMGNGEEIGGDKANEESLGSDQSTLSELGIKHGDRFTVEKSKISLKVKMPYGIGDVEVVVDVKNDTVDPIRQQIFHSTGLEKGYQQRFTFNEQLLDSGYPPSKESGSGHGPLSTFGLKEYDLITLDGMQLYIVKIPGTKQHLVKDVDPFKETIYDLKKRIAGEMNIHPSKQRLIHPQTEEIYVGEKDDTKTILEYGILDGDVVNLEKSKLDFRVNLPTHQRLELIVDPRKDDMQKIRDLVFKRYYKNRVVPKEDMRPMVLRGTNTVLDDEPGNKKLIEFGVNRDNDYFTIQPCYISIETPTRTIICPNADPFHDTLQVMTDFVKHEGINVDGLYIEWEGKRMSDYETVMYDLGIKQDAKLIFKK